ncbi:MAG: pilus assembly protein PilP [Burkholderiales bacterium]|nr:pilus assembly protein PilP [Burkholderiales bacterium]
MRWLLLLACASLLAACGGEQHSDLKAELRDLTKDLRGRVDPLPAVRTYESVPYTAEAEIDPFRPDRIIIADKDAGPDVGGGRKPDFDRPKEPLEAFPLESIQMVGTITQKKETFGLVKAGQNLYRVKTGNYMGQNFGVIVAINEGQIELKELVQDGSGEWNERTSALQLLEGGSAK